MATYRHSYSFFLGLCARGRDDLALLNAFVDGRARLFEVLASKAGISVLDAATWCVAELEYRREEEAR